MFSWHTTLFFADCRRCCFLLHSLSPSAQLLCVSINSTQWWKIKVSWGETETKTKSDDDEATHEATRNVFKSKCFLSIALCLSTQHWRMNTRLYGADLKCFWLQTLLLLLLCGSTSANNQSRPCEFSWKSFSFATSRNVSLYAVLRERGEVFWLWKTEPKQQSSRCLKKTQWVDN